MKKIQLTLMAGLALAAACTTDKNPEVKDYWPQAGVTYEIFVQSFHDSDGDGIGDLNGVTGKLDYVKELGAIQTMAQ
jgi:alpha-amylase